MNGLYFLLYLFVFLTEIATDIYVPSMCFLEKEFMATSQSIQYTMSFHLLGFALGQPLYGILSDRWGRKKLLLVGAFLFFISSFCCAFSGSIHQLIMFRFIQGLGACAAPVLCLAILRDICGEGKKNIKMISIFTIVVSLSPILGPILGALMLQNFSWKASFYFIFYFGLVGLPAFVFIFQKYEFSSLNQKKFQLVKSWKQCFSFSFFRNALINGFLVSCVWMFITVAPFILMKVYDLSLWEYGVCQAITVIFYMTGGAITHKLIEKWEDKKLLNLGFNLACLAILGLLGAYFLKFFSVKMLIGCFSMFELGLGILRPVLLNRLLSSSSKNHGTVSGIVGTIEMAICGLFTFFLAKTNAPPVLSFVSLASLAVVSSYILSIQDPKSRLFSKIIVER